MSYFVKNVAQIIDSTTSPPTIIFSNETQTKILTQPSPQKICLCKIRQVNTCYSKQFCCENNNNIKNCKLLTKISIFCFLKKISYLWYFLFNLLFF